MKLQSNIHCLSLINYDAVEDVTGRYSFWVSYLGIPRDSLDLGPLHMSPVDRAGPLTGKNFTLGSYEKLQPGFRDEKRPKILGTSFWREIRKTKQRWRNATELLFCAYHGFGNPFNCITTVKRVADDVENSSGKVKRCHSGCLDV